MPRRWVGLERTDRVVLGVADLELALESERIFPVELVHSVRPLFNKLVVVHACVGGNGGGPLGRKRVVDLRGKPGNKHRHCLSPKAPTPFLGLRLMKLRVTWFSPDACSQTWAKQALSARGFKRVGRHSDYAIKTVWRCFRRGTGGPSEPPEPPICFSLSQYTRAHWYSSLKYVAPIGILHTNQNKGGRMTKYPRLSQTPAAPAFSLAMGG